MYKGFPSNDSDSRMFPIKHFLLIHLNIEHLFENIYRVRNKIGPEIIFAFEESISDIAFEFSNQNEPLCVAVIFLELIWTFSKQIWTWILGPEQR